MTFDEFADRFGLDLLDPVQRIAVLTVIAFVLDAEPCTARSVANRISEVRTYANRCGSLHHSISRFLEDNP